MGEVVATSPKPHPANSDPGRASHGSALTHLSCVADIRPLQKDPWRAHILRVARDYYIQRPPAILIVKKSEFSCGVAISKNKTKKAFFEIPTGGPLVRAPGRDTSYPWAPIGPPRLR